MIDEINSDIELNQVDEDIDGVMSSKDKLDNNFVTRESKINLLTQISDASFSEKSEGENIYCKDDVTNDKSKLYDEVEKTNFHNSQLSSIKGEAENIDDTKSIYNKYSDDISFRGYSSCSRCACGGFEGYGQCCTNCGHNYHDHY